MPRLGLINKHPLYTFPRPSKETGNKHQIVLGHFCSKTICFSLSCADSYIQVEHLNWLQVQKMLCAKAVFLQLDSDAEREWQNRIYGERKTHKQMASLPPSCSTLAGNMPYFRKLMPNYCFGFPMGRASSSKLNIYFTEIQRLVLQSSIYLGRCSHTGFDHLCSEHWRAPRV